MAAVNVGATVDVTIGVVAGVTGGAVAVAGKSVEPVAPVAKVCAVKSWTGPFLPLPLPLPLLEPPLTLPERARITTQKRQTRLGILMCFLSAMTNLPDPCRLAFYTSAVWASFCCSANHISHSIMTACQECIQQASTLLACMGDSGALSALMGTILYGFLRRRAPCDLPDYRNGTAPLYLAQVVQISHNPVVCPSFIAAPKKEGIVAVLHIDV